MSQLFRVVGGSGVGGVEKITPELDSGGGAGLPVGPDGAFNLNLLAGSGITTTGDVATNTITVNLEGYSDGATTTSALETKTLITIPTSNDKVTHFDCIVAGYATPTVPGATVGFGGYIAATFITGGGVATQINSTDFVLDSFITTTCTFTCTSAGTNILIQVTGDAGYNIKWSGRTNYISTI